MEHETTNNAPGSTPGFNPTSLFFPTEPAAEIVESVEDGADAPLEQPAAASIAVPDDGGQDAGATQSAWSFNGTEYTEEQISEALKHAEMFNRFNQTISPLVTNIKGFGDQAAKFQAMAVTECDNQITELKRALTSGQLNAQEYQLAHQQLMQAETRKGMLEQAGKQVEEQRRQALNNARRHNAGQVAAALAKNGWTPDKMKAAQSVAMGVMSMDAFADVVSPALMEVLHDAYELRSQRAAAAAKLQDKARKVVRTGKPSTAVTPPPQKKVAKAGDSDWMRQNIWGGR